ncbi:MAG: maltose/maltodextrin ABC transporter substrate-binding protein MalE [Hyphomicrobiales bacterium]|nr:MAG: maltose/maltodextrin ABC transporter substrate-binding protein MalE [Hyphomicrobiales bacterium]
MKSVVTIAVGAALLLGSTSLTYAAKEGELLIWIGTNRDEAALQTILDKFTADLGIPAKVEVVDPVPDKFQQAAATGDGPDIVMFAHDRFGDWAAGGLIDPVNPGAAVKDGILPTAWDAVTFGGKAWGYPVGVEAVGLVYNKALVPTPPATFDEVKALGATLGNGKTIMWDYNNAYFTMPLLAAGGGYAFEKGADGNFDATKTGVNNDGSIAGATVLKDLIDSGLMPKGVDYGVMDGAFAKGEVGMILNGPWSWAGYKTAGIDIGVAAIPGVGGNASKSFIGVFAFAVNAASPNKDLAVELLENYILTDDSLAVWNKSGQLGALADISSAEKQAADPDVAATLANAAIGVPMPSNPEMGKYWSAMGPALSNITSGTQDVKAALDDAAARILAP